MALDDYVRLTHGCPALGWPNEHLGARSRRCRRRAPVAAAVIMVGVLAAQAGAPAAAANSGFAKSPRGAYDVLLRAAAVVPGLDPLGVGASSVELEGRRSGNCHARAAGFEDARLIGGDVREPHRPEGSLTIEPYNPTDANDWMGPRGHSFGDRPQLRDIFEDERIADLPADGPGPRWQAACTDRHSGTATGHMVDVVGVQGAGSTVVARVDPTTHEYVGTARAFVAGLDTGRGTVDVISSIMQVRHRPGAQPTISYRIGGSGGTLASGVDVPYESLTEQFNAAIAEHVAAVAALGPAGLTLMGPTTSEAPDGHGFLINAPFVEVAATSRILDGNRGHLMSRTRLVTTAFRGVNLR